MTEKYCRIWAMEENKTNGRAHYCHARSLGLDGHIYIREKVPIILGETVTIGSKSNWEWILRACEPYSDKNAKEQCKGCQFLHCCGKKNMWGIL